MAVPTDPDFDSLFRRDVVEKLAKRDDRLGVLALEMISSTDEEAVFLKGAKTFFNGCDLKKRRMAIAFLANAFEIDRVAFKRYVRFKGLVNLMD